MKANMFSSTLALFFIFPLLSSLDAAHPIPPTNDFVSVNCRSTQYPKLCYRSLIRYADVIQNDRALLVETAISIASSRSQHISSRISREIANNPTASADPRVVQAFNFCVDMYSDITVQLNNTNRFFHEWDRNNKEEFENLEPDLDMSLSLALSSESQCKDAWKDVAEGPLKSYISRSSLRRILIMGKNQYYVVFVGKEPGIYFSWEECSTKVTDYSGGLHKLFKTYEQAYDALCTYHGRKNPKPEGEIFPTVHNHGVGFPTLSISSDSVIPSLSSVQLSDHDDVVAAPPHVEPPMFPKNVQYQTMNGGCLCLLHYIFLILGILVFVKMLVN